MSKAKIGDVVQVDPSKEMFGACFMTVSEVKPWGVQGYIQIPGKGSAYLRVVDEDFEIIGTAVWADEDVAKGMVEQAATGGARTNE